MTTHVPGGRAHEIIAVYITLPTVATITLALRVYVRAKLVKGSLEDWTAGLGWLFFVTYTSIGIAAVYHGLGQHMQYIPAHQLPTALKLWWFCVVFYAICNIAVKLSIALMLLRLVVEEYHRKIIYVVTGLIEVYSVAYFFGFIFQCIPSSYFWTMTEGAASGHCMDTKIIAIASYGYSIITLIYDWTMALLPWFVVRKMRLDLRTRLMVAFVLGLGSIASVATIVRIPYVPDLEDRKDFLYNITNVSLWSCCETGLSITASSAATLKPLFRKTSPPRDRHQTPKLDQIPLSSDVFSSGSTTRMDDIELVESSTEADARNETITEERTTLDK